MGDPAELLAQLVARSEIQDKKMAEQQQTITALLQQIKNPAPVRVQYVPAAPDDNEVRAEKVQKINLNIRKSNTHLRANMLQNTWDFFTKIPSNISAF